MCDISNTHICLESVTDDCDVFTDVCSIHVLDHGPGCFLPKPRLLFCALLCKYTMQIVTYHIPSIYMHVGLSVFSSCSKIFMWECFRGLFSVFTGIRRIRCWGAVLWVTDQRISTFHYSAAPSDREQHAGQTHHHHSKSFILQLGCVSATLPLQ